GASDLVVVNDRKRYIRWPGGTAHPAVLGPADVPALRASTGFFARKLDPAAWPEAYDVLHELADSNGCARPRQQAMTSPAPAWLVAHAESERLIVVAGVP